MSDLKPQIITGLPTGVKEAGQRVDFRPENFDLAIKTKGHRIYWSRATLCPCRNNDQTDQPSTTCSLCGGRGWMFFLPEVGLEKYATDIHGNPIQLNSDKSAVMIFGLITSITKDPQVYENFGQWVFGAAKVTVQPENKLTYRDRLICIDATMPWSQLIEYDGGDTIDVVHGFQKNGLRYPAVSVNYLRDVDTIYEVPRDIYINSNGGLSWVIPASQRPASDTTLTINYTIHPVFRVLDHVYAIRDTLVFKKAKTVADEYTKMPVHAIIKLDFLVDEDASS